MDSKQQVYEIKETVRKDGSIRKARRVKPGFVPQEEVPKYCPIGKRVQQSAHPPGWHPSAAAAQKPQTQRPPKPQPATTPNPDKIKIKVKKESKDKLVEEISEKLEDKLIVNSDPTIELSKKLKRIRKKLREVEALEEKIKKSGSLVPEKDQLEKISRKKKFEEEINQLEKSREEIRKNK